MAGLLFAAGDRFRLDGGAEGKVRAFFSFGGHWVRFFSRPMAPFAGLLKRLHLGSSRESSSGRGFGFVLTGRRPPPKSGLLRSAAVVGFVFSHLKTLLLHLPTGP